MNYDNIEEDDAVEQLINDFSLEMLQEYESEFDHFEASDILYYADAFGNLKMAFVLQGFDKTMPSNIHKELYNQYKKGVWDILEIHNTNDIATSECPVCYTELYHFQTGRYNWEVMNEHGDVTETELLHDDSSHFWYPEHDETGDYHMCNHCRNSFRHYGDEPGNVRLHLPVGSDYNSEPEITGFTTVNGVIRFDDYYKDPHSSWVPLCDVSNSLNMMDFAVAHVRSRDTGRSFLEDNGWVEITYEQFARNSSQYGAENRFRRKFENFISRWSKEDFEIHPEMEEPYLMIDGTRLFTTTNGEYQVYDTIAHHLEQVGLDPAPLDPGLMEETA